MTEKILTKQMHIPNIQDIEVYVQNDGYKSLEHALKEMTPETITEEVTKSNIRGRGGAGFPMGRKWQFVPKNTDKPVYLICNCDESEPGTFKDRFIVEKNPHMLLEGITIASYAIGCHSAYIYIRGEFYHQANLLEQCIEQARAKGFLGKDILGSGFDLDIYVHRGAGAYICGEETALLESLEGKRGFPRLKPPFPAVEGFMRSPTIVNNVETLANIPWIIEHGGDKYAAIGTEKSTGTRLFSVSGHVNKPGVYELPHGISLRELIYDHCGGIKGDRPLKAIIPGGSSVPVLNADSIDMKLDYESVEQEGSMLGSAAVIIMDDSVCMVKAILRITQFYAHESCGQCTPCREGVPWMVRILQKLENGQGEMSDIDLLTEISHNIAGRTICPLGDAAAMPVESFVRVFRSEFEDHVREKRCTVSS